MEETESIKQKPYVIELNPRAYSKIMCLRMNHEQKLPSIKQDSGAVCSLEVATQTLLGVRNVTHMGEN